MFTGIVEETGEIDDKRASEEGVRLRVATDLAGSLTRGQSVSVSGVCLTVEEFDDGWFEVFLSEETVEKTYLSELDEGDVVNIERALGADERLDGHFVQGHVDGVTRVTWVEKVGEDWVYGFETPDEHSKYVVEKGSVSLDGISLTVAEMGEDEFEVAIVPETRRVTNLSEKERGDSVNYEVDVVAKYVESVVTDEYVG
ncbi:MAG: riboflavin synthase [Halobacteria archaeon]|nr:riboflavin synthase [Halobacteria archaeon]